MRQPNDETTRDERLSRYFDGELPPEDREAVRLELESDELLRAKLEGLRHLGALVTAGVDDLGADLDTDALFEDLEARLASDIADDEPLFPEAAPADPAPRPALRVIEGEGVDREASPREAEPEVAPLRAPAAAPAPRGGNRGMWIVGATALAAAAAVLFFVLRGDPAGPTAAPDEPVVAEATPQGSEVEEVDFGFSTGAIFSVEGQEGERYAVVWISDEKVEEEEEEAIQ